MITVQRANMSLKLKQKSSQYRNKDGPQYAESKALVVLIHFFHLT